MVLWFLPNLPIPPPPALRVGATPAGRELPQGAPGDAAGAPAPRRRGQQQARQQQRLRHAADEGHDDNNNNNEENGAEEEEEEEEDDDEEDEDVFNIYRALTRRARGGGGRRPLVHVQKWLFLFVMLLSMSPLSSLYHLYNAYFFPTASAPATWIFSGTPGSRSSTHPPLEELLRVLFETAMEKTTNMKNSMTTATTATRATETSAEVDSTSTTSSTDPAPAAAMEGHEDPEDLIEDVQEVTAAGVHDDDDVVAAAAVAGAAVAAATAAVADDHVVGGGKAIDLPQVLGSLPRNIQDLLRELVLAATTTSSTTANDDEDTSAADDGDGQSNGSERQTASVMAAADLLQQVWYDPLLASRWTGGGMAADSWATLLDYWNANNAGDNTNSDENMENARHYMTVVLPWMISMTFGLVIPMLMSLGVACCMQQADRRRRRRRPLFWWHLEEEDEEDDEFDAPPPPEEREEVVTERKLLRLLRNLRPFKKKLTASEFVINPPKRQTATLAQGEMGALCDSCNVLDDCSIGSSSKGPTVFLRLPRGGISWEEASKKSTETSDENDTSETKGAVSPQEREEDDSSSSTPSVWRDDVPSPCVICLCPYTKGERVVWSSNAECSHVFHERCLVTWFLRIRRRRDMVCPCCRRTFISSSKAAAAAEKN